MSWLRLDDNYASDGKVRRARAVMWWPIILCAMKRGGGVASDDDISPDVLADIGQGDEASAARAVEGLKSSGLLIQDGSGWTTPNWREFQPDPTGSTRQRALRERNKAAHDSVTVRNSDSPLRNGVSRSVTPDSTGRDIQDKTEGVVVVADTPREAEQAPAEPSPTPTPPTATPTNEPDLRAACDAYQRAMPPHRGGGVGVFMPPALVESVRSIAADFGPAMVISAVEASVEAKGHVPGPAYVRRICDRLRAEQNRPAALPFKVAAPQVEEPMSDDEKRDIMARLQALEI